MKKVLISILASVALVFCVSCKKDKVNPADDFVGSYTVKTVVHFNNVPLIGEYDQAIEDMEVVIAKVGDDGDVSVTMAGQQQTGHVTSNGLRLEPVTIPWSILGVASLNVDVTFPIIEKPVQGSTSWKSDISTTIYSQTISGTADMVATMK